MLNPLIAGFAQAGADATQNIATSMAKTKAAEDERKAGLVNTLIQMGNRGAAVSLIKEIHPETANQDFTSWIAEGEQEKKLAKFNQAKTFFDAAGGDAAKAKQMGESYGFTAPEAKVTSTEIKTIQKPFTSARPTGFIGPMPEKIGTIHAPVTTTKIGSLYDLMPKPKPQMEVRNPGDQGFEWKDGKWVKAFEVPYTIKPDVQAKLDLQEREFAQKVKFQDVINDLKSKGLDLQAARIQAAADRGNSTKDHWQLQEVTDPKTGKPMSVYFNTSTRETVPATGIAPKAKTPTPRAHVTAKQAQDYAYGAVKRTLQEQAGKADPVRDAQRAKLQADYFNSDGQMDGSPRLTEAQKQIIAGLKPRRK